MKLSENLKRSFLVALSFVVVFVLFNLDKSGQITAAITEYFPEKDTILSLGVVALLFYAVIKGIRTHNGQSLEVREETKVWYILLLMTCSFTFAVVILTTFF
jgi:hypothetical protein